MTGTAFDSDTFNKYNYNSRSEITGGQKYSGTDTSDTSSPVSSYDYGFDYDPIGNREESSTGILPVTTYTTNNLNQYTAISSLTDPQHDLDGNMTLMPSSSGDWNLTWNGENRLINAENGSTKLEFTYDYKGRRIEKEVYTWDSGAGAWSLLSHEKFVYDEWNLIEVLDATDSNAVVKTYTWGLDLSGNLQGAGGVGGLLSVTKHDAQGTTNAYYVSYDANGNISEYVDASGKIVAHYEYSPFGKLTVSQGSKAGVFAHRFSTKYFDGEIGLYYYGFRYYSSELGRWLSRDPIEERGSTSRIQRRAKLRRLLSELQRVVLDSNPPKAFAQAVARNVYAFCLNNPINSYDVLGELSCTVKYARLAALQAQIASTQAAIGFTGTAIASKLADLRAAQATKSVFQTALTAANQALQYCLRDPCRSDCSAERLAVATFRNSIQRTQGIINQIQNDLNTLYQTMGQLVQRLGRLSGQFQTLSNRQCSWP